MKKILFITAMEKEGKQIAGTLKMKEIEENLFENSEKGLRLLITGVGKQLTAINLTQYLGKNGKPDSGEHQKGKTSETQRTYQSLGKSQ